MYRPETLEKLLERNGWRVEEWRSYGKEGITVEFKHYDIITLIWRICGYSTITTIFVEPDDNGRVLYKEIERMTNIIRRFKEGMHKGCETCDFFENGVCWREEHEVGTIM